MFQLSDLNPTQRDAASKIHGPILILAGAGTGKTKTMTYRIANMLERGIPAKEIVAVTFTNKAAGEMRERIAKMVAARHNRDLQISTFHSYCLRILKSFWHKTGLRRGFNIIDTSDQVDLVRKALNDLKLTGVYQPFDMLMAISQAKNVLLPPSAVPVSGEKLTFPDLEALAMTYEYYEKQLIFNNVIDFDDCIYRSARLLQSDPEVLEQVIKTCRYLMVDEFQDTNFAQLSLVQLLAKDHRNVCVVGDDDQSIYSWRGAMFETVALFESYFPETKIIRLEQNYRCTNVILNAANQVIRNNPVRKEKTLWSARQANEPIRLNLYQDEIAEANGIAEKILGLTGRGLAPGDIAILVRQSSQAKPLELALRELGIGYRIYGGQSFFERKEVKDFLSYLRVVVNPKDHLGFYRIINTPNRGIGIKTLEKIHHFSVENRLAPLQAINDPALPVGDSSMHVLHEFFHKIHVLHALPLTDAAHFEHLGQEILKEFKLGLDVESRTKDPDAKRNRLEMIRSLPAWIAEAARSHTAYYGHLDPLEFLNHLTLDQTQGPDKNKKNSGDAEEAKRKEVSVMTIHASKGLEFPAVFVCGMEDDILPHKNSHESQNQLCEERRLVYVALTRAKNYLFLSYCHYRNIRKSKVPKMPSRFVRELPQEGVVLEDAANPLTAPVTKEVKVAKTLERLSRLRESLASA